MGSVIIMIVDICGVYPNVSSVGISSCRWFAAEMCVGINFIINIIVSLVWLFCYLFSMLVFGISKVLLLGVNRLYLPILFVVPYSFENWIFFVHVG